MEGVHTFAHPQFGTCLAASTDFAKGQVVLKEKPLLLVPADTLVPPALLVLAARNSLGEPPKKVFRTALVLASMHPDVCSSVLKELFVPDIDQDPSLQETTGYKCSKAIAGAVAQWQSIHANELLKGLLAVKANAHGFEGGQAVFKYGSKLAHTCNQPNTKFKSTDDGYGCLVAVTNIRKGDLLTTTYIAEEHVLCSTPARCEKRTGKHAGFTKKSSAKVHDCSAKM
ncbi:hypothetical protein DUNSADRAFT_12836 [Dunaliella salina]|uniref:SET domain-containing protein n=1 Tax=Dunaliella salina TaxID=3046 RepID=A0ABQ7H9P9_DUNSA|nr:hypothetical protein DUNSADRAFT_12836 [Dunaliella salina]|eukprot:KAF5843574.1 hypothetical protein DUNSADRAFT_12836 [Dunaliella salina]